MNDEFLPTLMRVAQQVTQADRAAAADTSFRIVAADHISEAELQSADFSRSGIANMQRALQSGDAVISNNAVNDLTNAPTTNASFADLRCVVVIPVAGYGAIYLDQMMRNRVITKPVVDRLMKLVQHVVEHGLTASSEAELLALYQQYS